MSRLDDDSDCEIIECNIDTVCIGSDEETELATPALSTMNQRESQQTTANINRIAPYVPRMNPAALAKKKTAVLKTISGDPNVMMNDVFKPKLAAVPDKRQVETNVFMGSQAVPPASNYNNNNNNRNEVTISNFENVFRPRLAVENNSTQAPNLIERDPRLRKHANSLSEAFRPRTQTLHPETLEQLDNVIKMRLATNKIRAAQKQIERFTANQQKNTTYIPGSPPSARFVNNNTQKRKDDALKARCETRTSTAVVDLCQSSSADSSLDFESPFKPKLAATATEVRPKQAAVHKQSSVIEICSSPEDEMFHSEVFTTFRNQRNRNMDTLENFNNIFQPRLAANNVSTSPEAKTGQIDYEHAFEVRLADNNVQGNTNYNNNNNTSRWNKFGMTKDLMKTIPPRTGLSLKANQQNSSTPKQEREFNPFAKTKSLINAAATLYRGQTYENFENVFQPRLAVSNEERNHVTAHQAEDDIVEENNIVTDETLNLVSSSSDNKHNDERDKAWDSDSQDSHCLTIDESKINVDEEVDNNEHSVVNNEKRKQQLADQLMEDDVDVESIGDESNLVIAENDVSEESSEECEINSRAPITKDLEQAEVIDVETETMDEEQNTENEQNSTVKSSRPLNFENVFNVPLAVNTNNNMKKPDQNTDCEEIDVVTLEPNFAGSESLNATNDNAIEIISDVSVNTVQAMNRKDSSPAKLASNGFNSQEPPSNASASTSVQQSPPPQNNENFGFENVFHVPMATDLNSVDVNAEQPTIPDANANSEATETIADADEVINEELNEKGSTEEENLKTPRQFENVFHVPMAIETKSEDVSIEQTPISNPDTISEVRERIPDLDEVPNETEKEHADEKQSKEEGNSKTPRQSDAQNQFENVFHVPMAIDSNSEEVNEEQTIPVVTETLADEDEDITEESREKDTKTVAEENKVITEESKEENEPRTDTTSLNAERPSKREYNLETPKTRTSTEAEKQFENVFHVPLAEENNDTEKQPASRAISIAKEAGELNVSVEHNLSSNAKDCSEVAEITVEDDSKGEKEEDQSISLPRYGTCNEGVVNDPSKELNTDVFIIDSDIEEGEVHDVDGDDINDSSIQIIDDNTDNEDEVVNIATEDDSQMETDRNPIFEVVFSQKQHYDKLAPKILRTLNKSLNALGSNGEEMSGRYELVDNGSELSIQAYELQTKLLARQENKIEILEVKEMHSPVEASSENPVENPEAADEIEEPKSSDEDLGIACLFTIDTSPMKQMNAEQVPSYKKAIRDPLDDEATPSKKAKIDDNDKCVRPRTQQSCFNCGSTEHSIRECSKRRNMKRIQKAKQKLQSRQERYHVDAEQRFAHLRPGHLSKELRSALGLERGELPAFIYRMRLYGYPPGWLEDAKIDSSGLALFVEKDKEVPAPNLDEGEVNDQEKFDVRKLVEYPGFNSDPGKNYHDDFKYHAVPPMNPSHTKEEFIKMLGDSVYKGYKHKKLKELPAAVNTEQSFEGPIEDMEIDDGEIVENIETERPPPPLDSPPIDDEIPPPPPPFHTEDSETPPPAPPFFIETKSIAVTQSCEPSAREKSPTLADLEAQQERLLNELETANTSMDATADLHNEGNGAEFASTNNSNEPENAESSSSSAIVTTPSSAPITPNTIAGSERLVRESHVGTPLCKFSPYDKLPNGENFKVGVSDVINFENLPDSTGKYEKMKGVLKKVRNIVSELQRQADD